MSMHKPKNKQLLSLVIMINVNKWLNDSHLVLNVKKTLCMFFTKTHSVIDCDPKMYVSGEIIVSHVKYLGIILDSTLSFKKQVKKVLQITKYNLANFRYIIVRNCLTTTAAKLYINAMIIPHLTYCMTTWSQAKGTTQKPILFLHKEAYKVLNRKPNTYHHCNILFKYDILSWDNLIKYNDGCLMFKILNGKAPPPLGVFIKQKNLNNRSTRSTRRGDCEIPFRSISFGQSCFSVRASQLWNTLPTELRKCTIYHSFRQSLKIWLFKKTDI